MPRPKNDSNPAPHAFRKPPQSTSALPDSGASNLGRHTSGHWQKDTSTHSQTDLRPHSYARRRYQLTDHTWLVASIGGNLRLATAQGNHCKRQFQPDLIYSTPTSAVAEYFAESVFGIQNSSLFTTLLRAARRAYEYKAFARTEAECTCGT